MHCDIFLYYLFPCLQEFIDISFFVMTEKNNAVSFPQTCIILEKYDASQ